MSNTVKKIILILFSMFFLLCLTAWLFACIFAAGQLYDTYNIAEYFRDAPLSVAVTAGLTAACIICLASALRLNHTTLRRKRKEGGFKRTEGRSRKAKQEPESQQSAKKADTK